MALVRVGLAQLNPVVGDLDGNVSRVLDLLGEAERSGCDVVAFPELVVTGYPPEDLLLKPAFVRDNQEALAEIAAASRLCAAVIGFVDGSGSALYNAVAVCAEGKVHGVYHKRRLPNYAVFDEQRYFEPGIEPLSLFDIRGTLVGTTICEDAWWPGGPIHELAEGGAELIINVNASPYHRGKVAQREQMLAERAAESGCPIAYVNMVGGQDELVFDGASIVVDPSGRVVARGPQYQESLVVVDIDVPDGRPVVQTLPSIWVSDRVENDEISIRPPAAPMVPLLDDAAEVFGALVLGVHDYVFKNGFSDVVLGLSGGVDSSLVAAIAVEALGPSRVHGVLMPSRFSSEHSVTDAQQLAANLGIEYRIIPIEPAHQAFLEMLEPSFAGMAPDTTEENIQARVRGTILMALSNKFGWLVLTTSNKSESAVGYATLYGDSAGGFAVIKDVPKTLVYELCRYLNDSRGCEIIPGHVLTKPPSAELRPNQRDDQSLPPYELLDPILEQYVEQDKTAGELIEMGFDAELVRRITRLVDINEYKRRQFPPGVRITTKAFGKDRRLPITNRYRG
ncbi:MAG: NAD+ synthase [Acidimicrobiales bacterium]|nr:NAD+ synthase [Acidimicrobiales bacterium]